MTQPISIIAEVAQAHDGSLGTAHAFIDAAADAGANAIKFQTHIANAESSPDEPWRIKFSPQDKTRYEYWERMEFTEEQWFGLRQHADDRGLLFYSSPFSIEAVDLLKRVGVAGWKIASGELSNASIIESMLDSALPILISTGMSPWEEIDQTVAQVRKRNLPFIVFQCTSMYPTPAEKLGLNLIAEIRERYNCLVGLSDHSGKIFASIAAATLGASAIEVHVTFHRKAFGPDVAASVTVDELHQLVEGVRYVEKLHKYHIDKDQMAHELQAMRDLFMKSLYLKIDLSSGSLIEKDHLIAKKPGTGISVSRRNEVIGKRITQDLKAGTMLREEHFE